MLATRTFYEFQSQLKQLLLILLISEGRQSRKSHGDFFVWILVVDQFSCIEVDLGLHIKMAVPTEVKQDRLFSAFFFAALCFADGTDHCVVGFWCRDDSFSFSEL